MPVTSYSRTPASNNSAPPNGWPEGQTPGSLNNSARQLMTDIVNEAGKNQCKVLGSVAGTNTITAVMSPTLDAYAAGMIVVFTPANTNTGATTLNIDSLGALDVLKTSGVAVSAGDLVAGVPALLLLDSGADDFLLINPATLSVASGSFTATLSGMSSATTGTMNYQVVGNIVSLWLVSSILGTSNSTSMALSGMPVAIRPTGLRNVLCAEVGDNGQGLIASALVDTAGGVNFTLLTTNVVANRISWGGAFTASGSKGLDAEWTISYPLT
jgi:hypothetical protein